MTADDLRTQKALALLDVEEASKACTDAKAQFDKLIKDVADASNLLMAMAIGTNETVLRSNMRRFEHVINVETLVAGINGLNSREKTLHEARQRLAVFRS